MFILVLHHKEKTINSAQFIEILKVKTTSEYTSLYIKDDCKNILYVTWEELVAKAEELSINAKDFKERYLEI